MHFCGAAFPTYYGGSCIYIRGNFVTAKKGLGGWRHLAGLAVWLHASFVVYKKTLFVVPLKTIILSPAYCEFSILCFRRSTEFVP